MKTLLYIRALIIAAFLIRCPYTRYSNKAPSHLIIFEKAGQEAILAAITQNWRDVWRGAGHICRTKRRIARSKSADTSTKPDYRYLKSERLSTVARGTALPWTFAVSGYSSPTLDGALHRLTWNNLIIDPARLIGHDLPADHRDENERVGSFYACHAEKQLVAYFI